MGVVHVQLDGAEKVLDSIGLNVGSVKAVQKLLERDLHVGPVDEILVLAPNDHLPGDDHLVVLLITKRGPGYYESATYSFKESDSTLDRRLTA